MKIKAAVTTLLAAAWLPAVGLAAEITVWEDWDFRGSSTVVNRATPRIEGSWNDRISSFRVDSGSWEVCRDWDYKNCRVVGPGTEEIARLESGWNDTISSLRPISSSSANVGAQETAARLYRGLLGREPDPEGLRNATAKVAAGDLSGVVNSLTQSQEFRSLRSQRSSTDLLDQMYRGLLGRPADTAARTAYLGRIEDGDFSSVAIDLVGSEEFGSAGSSAVAADTVTGEERRTRGRGEGVMLRGPRGSAESINSVKVLLGGDGRFRLTFAGSAPHQLEGTYVRESPSFARIKTIDTAAGSIPAQGGITLNNEWLERLDLEAGAPGSRDHVVYNFVAETFKLSQEETACQQQVRARLQQQHGAGVKVAFVGQQQSRIGGQRQELRGTAVILSANNATAEYRCQIDRSGQVLSASVQ